MLRLFLISIFYFTACYGWNKLMETSGMYQGDIQLTPDQMARVMNTSNSRGSTFGSIVGRRWPGGNIAYVIENSIGSRGREEIKKAIEDYHRYTCLRFHQRTNERNYISFYNGRGCNSPVGMWGRNRISLESPGCQNKGTIIHEIGHSIGLQHEQCRPDRDGYVTIKYENIDGPWAYAFNIERNVDSLGTPYDLESIMHYGSTAFAKRGYKTIYTKDPLKQHLIDRWATKFSSMDIKQINLMYKDQCGGRGGNGGNGGNGGGGSSCTSNKDKDCDYYVRQGYCNGTYQPWMKENCCKGCGY